MSMFIGSIPLISRCKGQTTGGNTPCCWAFQRQLVCHCWKQNAGLDNHIIWSCRVLKTKHLFINAPNKPHDNHHQQAGRSVLDHFLFPPQLSGDFGMSFILAIRFRWPGHERWWAYPCSPGGSQSYLVDKKHFWPMPMAWGGGNLAG